MRVGSAVKGCEVGEPEVVDFAEFARSRYSALVRSAFLLTGDRGTAEDVVQAALIKTFGAWSRLAAPQTAEAYTRTAMIRLAGRWRRRRWHGEIPSSPQWMPTQPSDVTGVETHAAALDVRVAVAALPWKQRAVIVLRFFDDLSERDTAAALGCSVGTVKSRLSRALAALRGSGLLTDDSEETLHDQRST